MTVDQSATSASKLLEVQVIANARNAAAKTRADLAELLSTRIHGYTSDDTSIVVFGPLARGEWTSRSDLDWTYLIDGQANSDHLLIAQDIHRALKEKEDKFRPPGLTGIFGNMAFSHDIIHQIGGENDTNKNTTQRILLLLESTAIGKAVQAHERVIKGVINRYLEEDTHLLTADGKRYRVPRFLLNDIVRFWRTMAVDFANKQRDRAGEGWGLRNAKLRMSRKLYAEFLEILDNDKDREALKRLRAPEAGTDPTFNRVRDISRAFEHALDYMFFENTSLAPLTRKYGLF